MFLHDDMEDDQAIVINVQNKMVVLSGCPMGIVKNVDESVINGWNGRGRSLVDFTWAWQGMRKSSRRSTR